MEFFKELTPNYNHKAERRLMMKPFKYIDNEHFDNIKKSDKECYNYMKLSPLDKDRENNLALFYCSYDMNKAYHTAIYEYSKDYEEIPVFSASDIIEEYNGDRIVDKYYYFINKNGMHKLRNNEITKGYYSNILHGFEIKFLLDRKIINRKDISHHKKCSYSIFVGRLKEIFRKVRKSNRKDTEVFRNEFFCNSGIFGKTYKKYPKIKLQCEKEDDRKILYKNHNVEGKMVELSGKTDIEIYRKNKYRYKNNRNTYNFIIAKTREVMMCKMESILKKNIAKNNKIYKINTDSFTIRRIRNVNYGDNKPKDFKIEEKIKFVLCRNARTRIFDCNECIKKTKNELDKAINKI
jgi:hypothetical protein